MNALVPITQTAMMPVSDVERVAVAIAKGGLFGSRDVNAVLTLCLLAQAEGQHPAVVFRDYHLINGKPAKKAEAMLRDFISSGGKVEWHTLTDEKADATFIHPFGGTVRIDWTLQRARDAGIANPMWKKYPRQMLRSRVVSEGVRSVCPGATSGLYEVGEVQDIIAERSPAEEVPEGGFVEGQFEERKVSPDGSADKIAPVDITKIQMLLKATSIDEITFLRGVNAPAGAKICDMPSAVASEAIERLQTKLATMAKQETAAKATNFGELIDDEIPY